MAELIDGPIVEIVRPIAQVDTQKPAIVPEDDWKGPYNPLVEFVRSYSPNITIGHRQSMEEYKITVPGSNLARLVDYINRNSHLTHRGFDDPFDAQAKFLLRDNSDIANEHEQLQPGHEVKYTRVAATWRGFHMLI
ncbi:MAG: hypothetical protein CMH61_02900 [Nanoarchaeota archaeon]|nr:hypothetical protein [Nanoarchaeota archaeon]|tara:strand:+ start:2360 stop:2767 length:408 start_codon:yes stop_codon:yes gene_type:complete